MKLTFRLRFRTRFGQSLLITGNHPALGNGDIERAVPLHYVDPDHWEATVSLSPSDVKGAGIGYEYVLREADGSQVQDWGKGRALHPEAFGVEEMFIIDTWNDSGAVQNAFYTEPFERVLLDVPPGAGAAPGSGADGATHTFEAAAPLLTKDQTLCLLGEPALLGNWNTTKAVLMRRTGEKGGFGVRMDLRGQSFPIQYKYAVYDLARKSFIRYEDGENRVLNEGPITGGHTVVRDGFAVLPVDTWKGAGVAIPVFSLRSERSFGTGEFADLKSLADWGKRVGLKLIQLLPINDTSATLTWKDSYPYSAISAFALHPLYLNLANLAEGPNRGALERLEPERRRLNALEDLDYQAVIRAKLDFVRKIYLSQRQKTFQSEGYREFFRRNGDWLVPYAAFCYLRDKNGTADFNQWPAHRHYEAEEIRSLISKSPPAQDEVELTYFIQYHLHLQLKDATEYARATGVIVKGDLPIGVYRYGADAWCDPELYHMEFQAGAPPDPFSATGQNWSFPTYNWRRMKEDGYAWWKQRLSQMSDYFDAFRIDHILGFFRIWSIPWNAVEGLLGFFDPAIPVDVNEFKERNIWFDRERYTRPYITEEILQDVFENDHGLVKSRFLNPAASGDFELKREFATQRQVEQHFESLPKDDRNGRIKQGLYDLISNVILFEVEGSGGRQYHFRFFMERTSSFNQLPAHTQEALRDLYIDYFWRRQEGLWKKEGLEKLPALKRVTNMLVCGEDLGMVPACVPVVMKQLGLLSLEVQRMPKGMNQDFSRPKDAPYLSVVTPSTHDMSTIRGWWEEDRNVTQKFYAQELGRTGEAPARCEPWINEAIIRQHLASPAMWSIFQLQDLMGMDGHLRRADIAAERINVPANPQYYWRYRMHVTLERLQQEKAFNDQLKGAIRQAGR